MRSGVRRSLLGLAAFLLLPGALVARDVDARGPGSAPTARAAPPWVVAPDPGPSIPAEVSAVLSAFARMTAEPLWPGFVASEIPLALFDGEDTWMVHHPHPPEGFRAVPGRADAAVFRGRHPTVRANTSTEMGGVETAVVILEDRLDDPPRELAGLLVHEAFHVFQRRLHPGWAANEVELLAYPLTDSVLLGLRRLETRMLREALRAGPEQDRRAHARAALRLREERFARLPEGAVAYERGTELNEGLARYVERRALGDADRPVFDPPSFPAAEVRRRAYATGQALALLLDGTLPDWKARLSSDTTASLDGLLASALGGTRHPGSGSAAPGTAARRRAISRAAEDIRTLEAERAESLESFLARPGWTVEILASGTAPLWPQKFDPLNLVKVAPDRVLHTRWLVLGNSAARVEVMDHQALSTSAGSHPLFSGVSRLLVTGLPQLPELTEQNGVVRLESPSLQAVLEGATTERTGSTMRVRLGADTPSGGQERSPFRMHADGVTRETRRRIQSDLRRAESLIADAFGAFPDTASVLVVPDRAGFSDALRDRWQIPRTACWMVGAADDHALILLSPDAWSREACEHDPGDAGHRRRLITHELIHVYHGQRNPSADLGLLEEIGWFTEGLAAYLSGQLEAEYGGRPSRALEQGAAPEELAGAWSGEHRYVVTGSMVAFIDEEWGRETLEDLLEATTNGEILEILGSTERRFIERWKGWVRASAEGS